MTRRSDFDFYWPSLPSPSIRAAKRAADGAKFLDRKLPGWWKRVDLDVLDQLDPDNCIFAQVLPKPPGRQPIAFVRAIRRFRLDAETIWRCGFVVASNRDRKALNAAWQAEVKKRRGR